MTADTSTGTQHSERLSPIAKQNLLNEIALGRLSLRQLAGKYSKSYQWVRLIASQNKEAIEKLREQYQEELAILWVTDRFNRQLERQTAIDRINDQQDKIVRIALQQEEQMNHWDGDSDDADRAVHIELLHERWDKLEDLKQKILRHVSEEEGQLPTRAPAQAAEQRKVAYEVSGVDLSEVTEQWERSSNVAS